MTRVSPAHTAQSLRRNGFRRAGSRTPDGWKQRYTEEGNIAITNGTQDVVLLRQYKEALSDDYEMRHYDLHLVRGKNPYLLVTRKASITGG